MSLTKKLLFVLAISMAFLIACVEDNTQPANQQNNNEKEKDKEDANKDSPIAIPSNVTKVIASISDERSNTFLLPLITFNHPVGSVFEAVKDGKTEMHRLSVDSIGFEIPFSNQVISFDTLWNSTRDSLYILPKNAPDQLPQISVGVVMKLEKRIEDEWVTVTDPDNAKKTSAEQTYRSINLEKLSSIVTNSLEGISTHSLYNPNINFEFSFPIDSLVLDPFLNAKVLVEPSFKMTRGSQDLTIKTVFGEGKRKVSLTPLAQLCSGCEYNIEVGLKLYWELFGKRMPVLIGNRSLDKAVSFDMKAEATSNDRQLLNLANIAYSYPTDRQYHFLQDEYKTGYLKLNAFQSDAILYYEAGSIMYASIDKLDSTFHVVLPLDFDPEKNLFEYDLTDVKLDHETIYRVTFFEIENAFPQREHIFHTIHFRTSKFDSFEEKLNDLGNPRYTGVISTDIRSAILLEHTEFALEEGFDAYEARSVDFTMDLVNTPYYNEYLYPLIYEGIDSGFWKIEDSTRFGVPPAKAITLKQTPEPLWALTDQQILNNNAPDVKIANSSTINSLALFAYYHRIEFRRRIENISARNSPYIDRILLTKGKSPTAGKYPYFIKYVLPGINIVSSELKDAANAGNL